MSRKFADRLLDRRDADDPEQKPWRAMAKKLLASLKEARRRRAKA
jgi:hypothetical protein